MSRLGGGGVRVRGLTGNNGGRLIVFAEDIKCGTLDASVFFTAGKGVHKLKYAMHSPPPSSSCLLGLIYKSIRFDLALDAPVVSCCWSTA